MSRRPLVIAGAVLLAIGLGAGMAAVVLRTDAGAPLAAPQPMIVVAPAPPDPQLGRQIYARCQACHGLDGQGIAGNYPPLAGSALLTQPDATPAIRLLLTGVLRSEHWNGYMPAFAEQLDDQEAAAVLTWTRSQWGNHAPAATAADVAKERR